MTIEKLERVMWRLRKVDNHKMHLNVLRKCIMREIGTDDRTYIANKKALIRLGWIKMKGKTYITLTDEDLDE